MTYKLGQGIGLVYEDGVGSFEVIKCIPEGDIVKFNEGMNKAEGLLTPKWVKDYGQYYKLDIVSKKKLDFNKELRVLLGEE